jgi:hypothetical protein
MHPGISRRLGRRADALVDRDRMRTLHPGPSIFIC